MNIIHKSQRNVHVPWLVPGQIPISNWKASTQDPHLIGTEDRDVLYNFPAMAWGLGYFGSENWWCLPANLQ